MHCNTYTFTATTSNKLLHSQVFFLAKMIVNLPVSQRWGHRGWRKVWTCILNSSYAQSLASRNNNRSHLKSISGAKLTDCSGYSCCTNRYPCWSLLGQIAATVSNAASQREAVKRTTEWYDKEVTCVLRKVGIFTAKQDEWVYKCVQTGKLR